MTQQWTPDRIKTLTKLWTDGLPTGEIGNQLGITKNAVIGKAHRLGLPKRQSPIRTESATSPKKKKAASPSSKPASATKKKVAASGKKKTSKKTPKGNGTVTLEMLTRDQCRWPIGEPGTQDFRFCGSPAVANKPYCAPHCESAYVKGSSKTQKETVAT